MPDYELLASGLLDIDILEAEMPAKAVLDRDLSDIEAIPVFVDIGGTIVCIDQAESDLYNLNTYAKFGPWTDNNGVSGVKSLPEIQALAPRSPDVLAKNASSELLNVPNEILMSIMGHLDLRSTSHFSATCSATHETARNYMPFKNLRNHAAWACRALVANGLVACFTLRQMYAVMCSKMCNSCWEPDTFATHIFLPTFERCCLRCLQVNPDYRMITPWTAVAVFSLKFTDLYGNNPAVPYAFCCLDWRDSDARYDAINGNYKRIGKTDVVPVVSVKQARTRSLEVHGKRKCSYSHRKTSKTYIDSNCRFLFGPRNAPCWNNYTKPLARRGPRRNEDGDMVVRDLIGTDVPHFRYNAAAPMPYFVRGSGKLHHGVWCDACLRKTWNALPRNIGKRVDHASYTRSQFLEHARSCQYVKRMTSSDSNPRTTVQQKAIRNQIRLQVICELQIMAGKRAVKRARNALRLAQVRAAKLHMKVEADNLLWDELDKMYQAAASVLNDDEKAEVHDEGEKEGEEEARKRARRKTVARMRLRRGMGEEDGDEEEEEERGTHTAADER